MTWRFWVVVVLLIYTVATGNGLGLLILVPWGLFRLGKWAVYEVRLERRSR